MPRQVILINNLVSSNAGNINFTGISGNGVGDDQNHGVYINGRPFGGLPVNGRVETTGSGNITFRGISNGVGISFVGGNSTVQTGGAGTIS